MRGEVGWGEFYRLDFLFPVEINIPFSKLFQSPLARVAKYSSPLLLQSQMRKGSNLILQLERESVLVPVGCHWQMTALYTAYCPGTPDCKWSSAESFILNISLVPAKQLAQARSSANKLCYSVNSTSGTAPAYACL